MEEGENIFNKDDFKTELDTNYHILSVYEVCRILQTHPENGLNNKLAQKKLARDGPNTFTAAPSIPEWVKYTKYWFHGFSLLLWCCFFLYMYLEYRSSYYELNLTHPLSTATSILIIILSSSMFQYFQQADNTKIIAEFKNLIPKHANVIRDGKDMQIRVEDLVAGDLIYVEGGHIVPADIRIVKTHDCKVNIRPLTGVTKLVQLTVEHTSLNPLETRNLAFLSAIAVEGYAMGIVIACGDHTNIGRTAQLVANLEKRQSPIEKELYHLIYIISLIALITAIFITLIGILPEGLITTLTVCVALFGAFSIDKNISIRHLEKIETLGSMSIICTGKTGTLTTDELVVSHIWLNSEEKAFNINTFQREEIRRTLEVSALFLVAIICNNYDFTRKYLVLPIKITYDPYDIALLKCVARIYTNPQKIKKEHPKIVQVPLNHTNKYYMSIHRSIEKETYMLTIKGDPETVLGLCATTIINEEEVNIDNNFINLFQKNLSYLKSKGEKLIALADYYLSPQDYPVTYKFDVEKFNFPLSNYRFLGILLLRDPLRIEVPEAMEKIRSAGIRIIMYSGDNTVKAKMVARAAGIISPENETIEDIAERLSVPLTEINTIDVNAAVINCNEFGNFTTDKLEYLLRNYTELVFANASPQQKFAIVENCQKLGALVGAIGNDISDCPALKQADVSISMGISNCSNIVSQVSDIILTNNNYKYIIKGIANGRLFFDNLKKVTAFILISTVSELCPFVIHIFFGNPNALSSLEMLLVELGTNVLPSIALLFEMAEENHLENKPRNPYKDRLINSRMFTLCYGMLGIIAVVGCFCTYLTVYLDNGFQIQLLFGIVEQWDSVAINDLKDSAGNEWTTSYRSVLEQTAHTAYFIAIVETQWAAAIVCKTRFNSIFHQGMKNFVLNLSIIVTGILAAFISYCPFSSKIGMYPLKAYWWLPALPFAVLMILFDECRKLIIRYKPNGWIAKTTFY